MKQEVGGSGLLGRQVLALFKAENVYCTGLCFSRASEGLVKLDITNFDETRSYIEKLRPTHVIHAAAQRFPDKVEADFEGTLKLNVESSRNLAQVCKELGSRMIYISTDYVFHGEEAMLAVDQNFIVLRIPVLYGGVTSLNESAVTVLLDVIRGGKPTKMSSYEVRCPSHTQDIAKILLDLIRKAPEGGVYQWCGFDKLSKWDMCQLIGKELSLDVSHLEEVRGAGGTPRPRDVELDREKLRRLGIEHHTNFKEGILAELIRFS